MPSYTDTSSGYVQWQTARRQAKQVAQDAAIDIIEHYNRVMLDGETNGHGRSRRLNSQGNVTVSDYVGYNISEENTPRADFGSKKLTPRSMSKKITTLKAENVDRKGGVFTEGISSLSRQSQFPVSMKRNDIISDNLPDNIKMAREKSRIYLALSHPGPRQKINKGDQSSSSEKSWPPHPSSYPWNEMLPVTEMVRAKTFTLDDRAGLSSRSTLDSRQTASDAQGMTEKWTMAKQGNHLSLLYPAITVPPPNTPLQMPPRPAKPKVSAVSIVSLGGETVDNGVQQKNEPRPRLPVPFRSMTHDAFQTKSSSTTTGDTKSSSKPGIDLPQLPLRYTEAKDASFQFTPRERPGRMNYIIHAKGRRRIGIGQLKRNLHFKSVPTALDKDDKAEGKITATDPYASRFQHVSTVTSLGDVHIPYVPSSSNDNYPNNSDLDTTDMLLPEPTIMLTVQEVDESLEKETPSGNQSEDKMKDAVFLPEVEVTPQAVMSQRVKNRTLSLVSNNSMLSVPLAEKDLSEARPPAEPVADPVILEIPVLTMEPKENGQNTDTNFEPEPDTDPEPASKDEEEAVTSPNIASTSRIDTARTIATQTSLPYEPEVPEARPTVLKIKTLSMFPDISGTMEEINPTGDGNGNHTSKSVASEPLLRMSHGDSYGEMKLMGLPELKGMQGGDRHPLDEDEDEGVGGLGRKTNGVHNMTFISPLEGQQKAKRF